MDLPGPEPDDRIPTESTEPDLERIAGDLADIERALDRLSDGSYWTDEVTGETIPDDVLADDPTARRVTYVSASRPIGAPRDSRSDPVDAGDAPDP